MYATCSQPVVVLRRRHEDWMRHRSRDCSTRSAKDSLPPPGSRPAGRPDRCGDRRGPSAPRCPTRCGSRGNITWASASRRSACTGLRARHPNIGRDLRPGGCNIAKERAMPSTGSAISIQTTSGVSAHVIRLWHGNREVITVRVFPYVPRRTRLRRRSRLAQPYPVLLSNLILVTAPSTGPLFQLMVRPLRTAS
jgi:hypothetical protein